MVINANYVVKINPSIDLAHASFLSCGFSTGFGSAWREANVEKGSSVAVIGLGAVGLGAIEGARMQGASKIIGIDKNEKKREKGEPKEASLSRFFPSVIDFFVTKVFGKKL
ncbi:unnamed protein product [Dovyalis caffra]|uniref:Alcohol dehydrogenase n=1 Tax=Dovyalis caffra TaxID=77055 RepID=A0AAV1RV31_9ROSI|nr:unnamed protein product [Dovyalis caffra]